MNVPKLELEQHEPDIGIVDRPLYSTSDTKITLDDSGSGNLSEVQKQLPIFLFHDFVVQLKNGDYNGEAPAAHLGPVIMKGEAHLRIIGNKKSPHQVKLSHGINGTFYGKLDHFEINGLTLGNITQFERVADIRNCILRGNGDACLSGKAGTVRVVNSEIGDGSDTHAVWPNAFHSYLLRGCDLASNEKAIRGPLASRVVAQWCGLSDDTPKASDAHRRLKDGVYYGGRRVAFDD